MNLIPRKTYPAAVLAASMALPAYGDFTLVMRDLTGGSDGNPNTTTEAETIMALAAPDGQYQYTDIVQTPNPDTINVAGGGSFSPTNTLPNGAGSGETYVLKATTNLVIPAGTWTIGFGSDDGGSLKIPGITFSSKVNNTAGAADEVRWENPRGHTWTFGTFTVASELITTLDALMYESGGGDSWEIALAAGEVTSFNTSSWLLLEDGALGWTVQTAPIDDTEPPLVDSLSPADDSDGVNPGGNLVATFNEEIALTGVGSMTLTDSDDGSGTVTISLPDVRVSVSGADLIVDPSVNLEFATNYEVSIDGAALEDTWTTPNAFAGTASGDWTFTTAAQDLTAPIVSQLSPVDDSSGVVPDSNLLVTFDDDVASGSGNITLVDVTDGSGTQVISVTDASQVSFEGKIMTINPASALEGGTDYAVQIEAGAVTNFSEIAYAGIVSPDETTWNFSVSSAAVFTTNANTGTNSDTWTAGANWDVGSPPSGILAGTVDSGLTALANSNAVVSFSGGLLLRENAVLQVGSGGSTENRTQSANALGSGTITMEAGSRIQWQVKVSPSLPPLVLNGDATIRTSSNESHSRNFTFAQISGAGQLSFFGTNNQSHTFGAASPGWSGGFVSGVDSSARTRFVGAAEQAFGTGNVTVGNRTDLQINNNNAGAGNVIDDSATLAIEGTGRDQSVTDKLIMNGSETVNLLTVDGFPYPAGTYGRPDLGTVTTELDLIAGNSILTVTNEPSDSTAPLATFVAVGAGGSNTQVFAAEPVTYTVTFDEPLTSAPSVSDFENAAATPINVLSVNDVSPNLVPYLVFEVVVEATAAGSLNLQVAGGTVLEDLFGNALVVPAADNDTITVNAQPAVEGQLGIWKPWANGGINPNTGEAWAIGDTYRIVFASSTTVRDATATEMQDYHDAITGFANNAGLGGSWFAIGTTDGTNGRTNTDTVGAGFVILSSDGSTKIADDYNDFWDGGLDNAMRLDESGNDVGNVSIATGMFPSGAAQGTGDRHLGGSSETPPRITHGRASDTGGQWARVFNGAASSEWRFYGMSAELTLQPLGGPAGYVAWAAGPFANPFTETVPGGNPDGDSMSNLLEFAFNADPTVNNDSALSWDGTTLVSGTPGVAVSGEGTNVGSPTARFIRRVDQGTLGSVSYAWQFSSDLAIWEATNDASAPTWFVQPTVITTVGDYELVEVPFPLLDNGNQARFFQVVVSEAE